MSADLERAIDLFAMAVQNATRAELRGYAEAVRESRARDVRHQAAEISRLFARCTEQRDRSE